MVILDDLVDSSLVRNQQPSWYSLPNIGKNAAIHAAFIESCIHFILKKHFSMHPQYNNILNIFLISILYTNYSQSLDILPFREENMTQEYLNAASLGKSIYGGYYACISLAMYLANIQNPGLYERMENILMAMGKYFQMQVRENC